MYTNFETWPDVFDAVHRGYQLYYQGPMDYKPVAIKVHLLSERQQACLRVLGNANFDSFTADKSHLPRFKQKAD